MPARPAPTRSSNFLTVPHVSRTLLAAALLVVACGDDARRKDDSDTAGTAGQPSAGTGGASSAGSAGTSGSTGVSGSSGAAGSGGSGTAGSGASGAAGSSGAAGASGTAGSGASGAAGGGAGGTGEPCSPGLGAPSDVPPETSVTAPAEPVSDFIVVDQFGYLPDSEKIAVVRDPDVGADAALSFTPGATYRLVDASTSETALEGSVAAWNGGQTHAASGDKAYWFDFSSVTTPGIYYVLDVENGVRSDTFRVASDVYREVLRQAVRTFYYQRAGFAKAAPFAEDAWVDGASHLGAGQDGEARLFSAAADAATARDLSGGWYDAGDYNKYTAWTADYIVSMLRAYTERPSAFGDDYGLPDSGNCIADIVDEARFGLEHLARLQEENGGVLSIVDLDHASPPSSAIGPSLYGPASANASLRAAAAFAWGARVFAAFDATFADALRARAVSAHAWAVANPTARFRNNEGEAAGIGAGQQEIADDAQWERDAFTLLATLALYQATGDAQYKSAFEAGYRVADFSLFSGWLSGWNLAFTDTYLDYAALPDADATVRTGIVTPFNQALGSNDNLGMLTTHPDPYLAHQTDYVWGSNAQKARIGSLFYAYVQAPDLDPARSADGRRAAERYVHYVHGVNPFGLVYLSAMERFGAQRSVSEFYHTWFGDGTTWDTNPAPGFLTGGPNASYNWDGQCPGHSSCPAEVPAPPYGQPPMKSYLDFNTNWPVNSWEVTENSNGYQIEYIRLLSKFVQ
jgi:endoglucanase